MVKHPIAPVYDNNSKILILGSFPSVKSREEMFFYGHPQNRFWKVLAGVFAERVPESIQEKRSFLLDHKIALWDVIASCDIEGSSDSSIKNVVPNNLNTILEQSNIEEIFVNGKTAYKYYNTYLRDTLKREAICLPSTSPANAAWNLEKLICAWSAVKK
ncbi:MAG: DNA-deoxyinosine glycosylase [Clostridia bacterium]|nr:DNA-deoxyinosine glycosylase [Clostridia bacterium]